MGFDVVNPARVDMQHGVNPYTLPIDFDWSEGYPDVSFDEFIERDLELIRECDAICVFGEWKNSVGAKMELNEAKKTGKKIYEL